MKIVVCTNESDFYSPGPINPSAIQPPPTWLQVPEGAALPAVGEVYTQWNGTSAKIYRVLDVNIWRAFYGYQAEPQCRILARELGA